MNFARKDLVEHFGSWIKVQVAFYDWLMLDGLGGMTANEFNKLTWKEGTKKYDEMVAKVEERYVTPSVAWTEFVKSVHP